MPTKKQLRRRQKERRHEWEEVYVDAEGNVVDPPPEDDGDTPARSSSKRQPARRGGRTGGRTVQPPSWPRVLKRGLIFAPLMYITVTLLAPKGSTVTQAILQTLFLLLIFVPFSYAMDAMTYRMWRRRTGEADTGGKRS
jgi:hypothetical protein